MRKLIYDRAGGESYEVERLSMITTDIGQVAVQSDSHGYELIPRGLWDRLEVVEMDDRRATDVRLDPSMLKGRHG